MKNKKKKTLVPILLCLISMIFFCGCNKKDINALENNSEKVSDEFINFVSDCYANKEKTVVIDYNGNDITNSFFEENETYYEQNDFMNIKLYFIDNVNDIYIEEIKSDKDKNAKSPFVNQTVSRRYYKVLKKDQAAGEIEYYLSGSFVWDRATYKITSIGNAKIDITHNNFGAAWIKNISNMYTNSSISGDKYYAYFSGGFTLSVSLVIDGDTYFTVRFDPLTAEATAYPEG